VFSFKFGSRFAVRRSAFGLQVLRSMTATLFEQFAILAGPLPLNPASFRTACQMLGHGCMSRGVKRFTDLRAWQACDLFKKAVYELGDNEQITRDFGRRRQLEESAARPTAHMSLRIHR
jgi:hypothetical protein